MTMISSGQPSKKEIILPATRGIAVPLLTGQSLTITNPHGNQVVDTWAICQQNHFEYGSIEHSRSVNSNLFFEQGMVMVSNHRKPMFTLTEDTTPGRHDTQLCPCNAEIYQELGCQHYHRNCTDNFHEALQIQNITLPFTPAPLNLFMNVPVQEDGSLDRLPPRAKAGDYVVLRAEHPIYVIVSACPQDITPINGASRQPAEIHLSVSAPAATSAT